MYLERLQDELVVVAALVAIAGILHLLYGRPQP